VVAVFMLPAGWLIIRTGPRWNVWDGYGRHWASSRLWLALPLLAGPGAISTVILFSQQSHSLTHKLILVAICCLTALLVWACLHLAPQISKRLSQTSLNISSRVMGLILAAMSVEFIVGGLRNLLQGA